MGWICDLCKVHRCDTCVMRDHHQKDGYYEFDGAIFETQEDMLEYAVDKGIVKMSDIIKEIEDSMMGKDAVQIVADYGDIDHVCKALLDYAEV